MSSISEIIPYPYVVWYRSYLAVKLYSLGMKSDHNFYNLCCGFAEVFGPWMFLILAWRRHAVNAHI